MPYLWSLLVALFLFSGCAPKAVDITTINPLLKPSPKQTIAVYEPDNDLILFHEFALENNQLVERITGKVLPFRVEFMDLWVTGLGHDIRHLTKGHAESIPDALMYAAKEKGMITLHTTKKDYIIEESFARDLITAINQYEEKMRRYERNRDFPILMRH